MDIFRPFHSVAEKNKWNIRRTQQAYMPYIKGIVAPNVYNCFVDNELGGIETCQSGYVDIPLMLNRLKAFFIKRRFIEKRIFRKNH